MIKNCSITASFTPIGLFCSLMWSCNQFSDLTITDSTFYRCGVTIYSGVKRLVVRRSYFYDIIRDIPIALFNVYWNVRDISISAEITDCVLRRQYSQSRGSVLSVAALNCQSAMFRNITISGTGFFNGMHLACKNVVQENVIFENVSATTSLLSIYFQNFSLIHSKFSSIKSQVFLSASSSQIRLFNCTFENNSDITLKVDKFSSAFFDTLLVVSNENLEFVFESGSTANISYSYFRGNIFRSKNLFSSEATLFTIRNCSFIENFMTYFSLISVKVNLLIERSVFDLSFGLLEISSGIYLTALPSSQVDIQNSVFSSGSALSGGCISLSTQTKSRIMNTLFENCRAKTSHGGSIYLGTEAFLSVFNSTFRNCFAELNGGCIFMDSSSFLDIRGTFFLNGSSGYSGGFVYVGAFGNISCTKSNFSSGLASFNGGCLFLGLKWRS
jgi:hypothetical protein